MKTLEDLINSLPTFEKLAADASDDKGGEKGEKDEKKMPPWMKGKEEKSEKPEAKDGKKEDKDEVEKKASANAGSALAAEILTKVASAKVENTQTQEGEQMNKQASEAGKTLAKALMEKLAAVGDMNTMNGVAPGTVVTKQIADSAAQVAEDDIKTRVMPGTDGLGGGGTVNEIFDALVADAHAQGAANQNDLSNGGTAKSEGAANGMALPNQVATGDFVAVGQEKAAAVTALVNDGVDFDDAVNLVKQASDALDLEESNHVKQAAFNELLAQGVGFDLAVQMIKQAGEKTVDIGREKQAAVNMLVGEGVEFDQAVELVNAKANELYGAK